MVSFAEFLKKEFKNQVSVGDRMVSVRALGEWALEEIRLEEIAIRVSSEMLTLADCTGRVYIIAGKMYIIGKIAVACLGEEEVRKRLEAKK